LKYRNLFYCRSYRDGILEGDPRGTDKNSGPHGGRQRVGLAAVESKIRGPVVLHPNVAQRKLRQRCQVPQRSSRFVRCRQTSNSAGSYSAAKSGYELIWCSFAEMTPR
jgi:hypothetical protein